MAKFIGRQQEVGLARETTRGTLVAPSLWIPKVNFSVEDKVSKARVDAGYGNISGGDDSFVAEQYAQGDLEFEAQDGPLALIMYALFGALSSGSFSSVFKHTFSLSNSVQHQSLSLHLNDPIGAAETPLAKTVSYPRAMVDEFEMNVRQNELAMCRVGFVGQAHEDFTRQTPSYTAHNKFVSKHAYVKVASALAGLDAASKIRVQELTLNIKKNIVRENSLGTIQPVDILNRKIEISGKIKLTYEDRTYRDYMMAGTTRALRIALANTDVTIGSTNPQFQLDLPKVDFTEWEATHALDELATQEIMFNALYDVANSILIGSNSFVVNSTSSY